MNRTNGPILKTVLVALLVFGAVAALQFEALVDSASAGLAIWFFAGLLYTQWLEWWLHRVPMHRGFPFLEDVRRNHLEHHRVFHGENFRTRRAEELAHIAGRYWIFPLLFALHYGIATAIFPLASAMAFLSGSVLHYLAFEITHWFTHVEDNDFDRTLERVPWLGRIRAYQIEHHRLHHEIPIAAFNFNPPYLGDLVAGSMPTPVEASIESSPPVEAPPLPSPSLLRRPLFSRQAVRYGAAVAVGVAAIGLAVVAHGWMAAAKAEPGTPSLTDT